MLVFSFSLYHLFFVAVIYNPPFIFFSFLLFFQKESVVFLSFCFFAYFFTFVNEGLCLTWKCRFKESPVFLLFDLTKLSSFPTAFYFDI